MTDRIPELHLADLRRIASGTDWSPPQPGDLADLIAEVDRLTAELAEARRALWIARQRTDSVRVLADSLKRQTSFGLANCRDGERTQPRESWRAVDYVASQLLAAIGPQLPPVAPQPPAERPAAGFAATETTETRSEPPRPAEAVGWSPYGRVTATVMDEPDAIAPEDEGISTADAHAQAASDAEHDPGVFVAALGKCRDPQCPVCVGVLKRTHAESEQQ